MLANAGQTNTQGSIERIIKLKNIKALNIHSFLHQSALSKGKSSNNKRDISPGRYRQNKMTENDEWSIDSEEENKIFS